MSQSPEQVRTVPADLVAWLRQQLDEDERLAQAASPGPWRFNGEGFNEAIYAADNTAIVDGSRWGGEASVFESAEDAVHIAEHDPARVLREIDAKRRILEECAWAVRSGGGSAFVAPVLRCLASVYADRPGYAEAVGE